MSRFALIALLLASACTSDRDGANRMEEPGSAGSNGDPGTGETAEPKTETCDNVGPAGRCKDGVLTRCDTGVAIDTNCAEQSLVCAYIGDVGGYACSDASQVDALEASGIAEYEDRPAKPGKLEPVQVLPIRGATAWVVQVSDNKVLGKAITADDGTYVIRYKGTLGSNVRVTIGTSSPNVVRPVKVIKNSGATHGLGSKQFPAAAATVQDILATEASDLGHAFNVYDMLIEGMDQTRMYGKDSLSSIEALYQRNANSGSFYQSGNGLRRMTVAGGPDDDGYDDMVILHEFGHYHQSEYGLTDNPGGTHPNAGGDYPTLAWAEGQATYLGNAMLGTPYYIDTNYQDGGWYVELEKAVHAAKPNSVMSQFVLEWMVAEILWDVGDTGAEDVDADGVPGQHADVIGVTLTYFHDPAFKSRGYSGADLVDGWFWMTGHETCSSMKLLMKKYGFPYDFGGPGKCP